MLSSCGLFEDESETGFTELETPILVWDSVNQFEAKVRWNKVPFATEYEVKYQIIEGGGSVWGASGERIKADSIEGETISYTLDVAERLACGFVLDISVRAVGYSDELDAWVYSEYGSDVGRNIPPCVVEVQVGDHLIFNEWCDPGLWFVSRQYLKLKNLDYDIEDWDPNNGLRCIEVGSLEIEKVGFDQVTLLEETYKYQSGYFAIDHRIFYNWDIICQDGGNHKIVVSFQVFDLDCFSGEVIGENAGSPLSYELVVQ